MINYRHLIFAINWIILGFISSVDTYFAIKYITIPTDEYNPIGRWLLIQGGMPLFMAFRMFGLSLALGVIIIAYIKNKDIGFFALIFTNIIYLLLLIGMAFLE